MAQNNKLRHHNPILELIVERSDSNVATAIQSLSKISTQKKVVSDLSVFFRVFYLDVFSLIPEYFKSGPVLEVIPADSL